MMASGQQMMQAGRDLMYAARDLMMNNAPQTAAPMGITISGVKKAKKSRDKKRKK